MYAVFEDRNQQFRAAPGDRIQIPLNDELEAGSKVTFEKVCLVTAGADGGGKIGTPYVDGVKVTATVLGMARGPELIVQKFRRRKNSRRRTGFRARYTELKIDAIEGV